MNRATTYRDRPSRRASLIALAAFIGICAVVGALGGMVTRPRIPDWYGGLEKPPLTPPDAVFGVVWPVLYLLIALSGWRAWRAAGGVLRAPVAFLLYGLQLALNLAWSFAFFAGRSPIGGLVVILLLIAAIAGTIVQFHRIDRPAAWLLAPYFAWVVFATYLNAGVAVLN